MTDVLNHTVEDYLISNNLDIPKEWQTNPDRILSEQDKQIIEEYCNYYNIKVNYNIRSEFAINDDENTIAMYLAERK